MHLKSSLEATRIADFTACPSHDRNDFGKSDVQVITTHFNGICESNDVTIDDALT